MTCQLRGDGLCFSSSHGTRIQTSRSSSVVRITGRALIATVQKKKPRNNPGLPWIHSPARTVVAVQSSVTRSVAIASTTLRVAYFVRLTIVRTNKNPRFCTAFPCCLAFRHAVRFARVVTYASADITAAIGRQSRQSKRNRRREGYNHDQKSRY